MSLASHSTQNNIRTFTLQRILKKLEKDGVQNVLFTDCLKQRDDSIKKVEVISDQTFAEVCLQLMWI